MNQLIVLHYFSNKKLNAATNLQTLNVEGSNKFNLNKLDFDIESNLKSIFTYDIASSASNSKFNSRESIDVRSLFNGIGKR